MFFPWFKEVGYIFLYNFVGPIVMANEASYSRNFAQCHCHDKMFYSAVLLSYIANLSISTSSLSRDFSHGGSIKNRTTQIHLKLNQTSSVNQNRSKFIIIQMFENKISFDTSPYNFKFQSTDYLKVGTGFLIFIISNKERAISNSWRSSSQNRNHIKGMG